MILETARLSLAWSGSRPALGLRCNLGDWYAAEVVARAGFDYVYIDQQHGLVDAHLLGPLLQVIGQHTTPLVRVRTNEASLIGEALDRGAAGVIVPLVNTPGQAAAAVAACRYPPGGLRSYGPIRASQVMGSREPEVLEAVLCLVMVETAEALENLEAIVTTPGVDGVYVGPFDLSLDLGLRIVDGRLPTATADAVEAVRQSCVRHGKVCAIGALNSDASAREYVERGFDMVTVGTDAELLKAGCARALRDVEKFAAF